MPSNQHSKGFPIDPISGRLIGQTALYALNGSNEIKLVSALNPLSIKRITNKSTSALILPGQEVTSGASVKIADANPNRRFFYVHANGDSKPVWIKLQSAGIDDDKKGIWVERKAGVNPFWQMPQDNIYTGEISAIADSVAVDVFVTEY